jgi:hypothetical protein
MVLWDVILCSLGTNMLEEAAVPIFRVEEDDACITFL